MGDPKIVITGTGRAGTTLLVRVLDELGLDTGLAEGKLSEYTPNVRAGLECRVDDPNAPTVVKDMTLGWRMREVLDSGVVDIRHVIVPTRRLEVAAASRIHAAGYGKLPFRRGALIGTMRATEQQQVLAAARDELMEVLTELEVPHTELEFPRFATDPAYTFDTLGFLVPGATLDDFRGALDRVVRPEMIHEEPLSSRERWRTRGTTTWMVVVRYPIAAVRRRLDPEGTEARLRASVAAARQREAQAAGLDDPGGSSGPAG